MGLKLNIFSTIFVIFLARYFYKSFNEDSSHERIIGPTPIVTTNYGKIQGIESLSRDGNEFYSYRGIPYAKPPIGNLRYEPPVEPEAWSGTLTTNKYGNICPQFDPLAGAFGGQEDCLFLNVFVPKAIAEANKLVPVMVYIHGGYFMFGAANIYGPEYFMDHSDIILVTINYRLGSLGFLNTNDGVVRGNMGLKDQAMALKWIQKNIKYFNGDPGQVTIFGESAGAGSVHLQVLSPTTKGLFHRAIPMSGSAISPWAITTKPDVQAKRHASRLSCARSSTQEMIQCLRNAPIMDIMLSDDEYRVTFSDQSLTVFSPTVENVVKDDSQAFITKSPLEIIKSGQFNQIPIIVGYNSDEGLLTAPGSNKTVLRAFNENFAAIVPNYIFHPTDGKSSQLIAIEMEEIRSYYFGANNEPIDDHITKLKNYTNLITDSLFNVGIQKSIELHAKAAAATSTTAPVYAYYYSYKGQFTLATIMLAIKGEYHPMVELGLGALKNLVNKYIFGTEPVHHGACHSDELALLFKMPGGMSNLKQSDKDYAMSKDMVKLWISFAKGESSLTFRNQIWPKIDSEAKSLNFLHIDKVASIIADPDHERVEFLSKYHFK